MTYPFEQLGSAGFQDLVGSLAVAVFGPDVQVMGAGSDGGRDMYVDGSTIWNPAIAGLADGAVIEESDEIEQPEAWSGYTVFQVKHKAIIAARPQDNAAWLWSQIRRELDDWTTPTAGRERTPRQLVFITNVVLTPAPGRGGHDHLRQNIAAYDAVLADAKRDINEQAATTRRRQLQRLRQIQIRIWDRNQLNALLNIHAGVRTAFKALLTVPDVLASLNALSDRLPATELEDGLRRHARTALLNDGRLHFAEAGGDHASVQVHAVAIDLPVLVHSDNPKIGANPSRSSLINLVIDQADHVLKPSVTTQRTPRHLILTGDPGNGKTTISRFLTQAYRAALLQDATNLGADHRAVVDGMTVALSRFNRPLPRHPRWPIRIDLAEYAQERGHLIEDTLLRWIAEKVNGTSNTGLVTPRAISTWQKEWPWFVVLDGLDEVTEPSVRSKVIDRVVSFVNEADGDDCDTFVMLTTRPVGYTEDISPAQFRTVSLADLTPSEAVAYGMAVTNLRLRDEDERRTAVVKRLAEAADSESFSHLLRTPLQVLILTIIIDSSAGNLAPDRFSLFWGYYDTVFTRERNKPTSLGPLLRDHKPQIDKIHEEAGYELQRRSEDGDRSYSALTEEELRRIARDVLSAAGHTAASAGGDLLERILTAATQRLVLIAPRGPHGFGFDVRPLQELSAARHLTNGEPATVGERLRLIAASPHWRNTWIFAAGRIFADRQDHLLQALVDLVEGIDHGVPQRLSRIVPVGPRLALDLLDDGMARAWPIYSDQFLTLGIEVLNEPLPPDRGAITRVLLRYADSGHAQRTAVVAGIRRLLAGPAVTRSTIGQIQKHEMAAAELQVHVRPATRGLGAVRKDPNVHLASDPVPRWDLFHEEIETAPLAGAELATLLAGAEAITSGHYLGSAAAHRAIATALITKDCATALESALSHVAVAIPGLYAALRDLVLPDIYRTLRPAP